MLVQFIFLLALLLISTPIEAQSMRASWYHEGKFVATGARYRPDGLTAAHRTLPFGTRLRVTYGDKQVDVTINDRGPAKWTKRELDLSRGAARVLGMLVIGVAKVEVDVLN